jgi:hypothetical protein
MVNPPRDEIPRIRMRLQEYGQVGDANVFYWFQNRKSRSKNKQRTGQLGLGLARAPGCGAAAPPVTPQPLIQNQFQVLASPAQAPASSSSSSSDRSSGSSKPAPQPMSATAAAMNFPGPLGAACAQMYYQAHPVAPVSALPAHKVQDPVASDEPVFQPWPQGYFLSAAEVASILGGQYRHDVPVQQQPPATLPAGAFLGLYNEVTEPTVTGHRTCAWGPAGLGQFWPVGGADHHQHHKHNTTAATNTVARDAAHEHATTLGLLQYGFEASAAMETASAAVPLAASPGTAASVATAGLTSLPASTNAVVVNYDLLQGNLGVPFRTFCSQYIIIVSSYAWIVFVWIGTVTVSVSHHMIRRSFLSHSILDLSSGSFIFIVFNTSARLLASFNIYMQQYMFYDMLKDVLALCASAHVLAWNCTNPI